MPPTLGDAALDFVGVRFRLQGRDPANGLDCIGLILASLERLGIALDLPADYRPRRRSLAIPEDALAKAGLIETGAPHRSGDILMLRTAPAQVHAAIVHQRATIVHAHAGLGRVVCGPIPSHWRIIVAWRLAPPSAPEEIRPWPR